MSQALDDSKGSSNSDVPESEREGRTGTLARGLAIVDELIAATQPLGLAEIAAATGLEQSTTLRLLRTLEENGYVVRIAESKRYSPSPKALRPLPLLHPLEQLRRESAGAIQNLANGIGKTVVLVVYVGTERLVLDIAQTNASLTPYYGTWLHGPLHCTGGGKALLVSLDSERRSALLGPEPYEALTPHTITRAEELDADLKLAEQRGYVVVRDEHRDGLTAVAANILTWNGAAAGCMVATGYTKELEGTRLEEVGEEVKRAASLLLYQAPSLGAVNQFCGL